MEFQTVILGAGAAGMMCAAHAGPGALVIDHAEEPGREDPHLGRRALQFHQSRHWPGEFPVGQPAFRQVGAGALHAVGFHRPDRAARHRLAREDPGAALLRRLGPAGDRDAARRDGGGGGGAVGADASRRSAQAARRIRPGAGARGGTAGGELPQPGAGDGRPVDPEDGGDRARLRDRPAVRAGGDRDPPRPGALHLPGGPLHGAGRRVGAGATLECPRFVRRGTALHPSRALRAGGAAAELLLARGRGNLAGPGPGTGSLRAAAGAAGPCRATPRDHRAGAAPAGAAGRAAGRRDADGGQAGGPLRCQPAGALRGARGLAADPVGDGRAIAPPR